MIVWYEGMIPVYYRTIDNKFGMTTLVMAITLILPYGC